MLGNSRANVVRGYSSISMQSSPFLRFFHEQAILRISLTHVTDMAYCEPFICSAISGRELVRIGFSLYPLRPLVEARYKWLHWGL